MTGDTSYVGLDNAAMKPACYGPFAYSQCHLSRGNVRLMVPGGGVPGDEQSLK